MFYGVDELVSYVSQYMTLEPGDVFFTGTSGESTPLNDGDVVEVEVEATASYATRSCWEPSGRRPRWLGGAAARLAPL